jgi:hypothetical protein
VHVRNALADAGEGLEQGGVVQLEAARLHVVDQRHVAEVQQHKAVRLSTLWARERDGVQPQHVGVAAQLGHGLGLALDLHQRVRVRLEPEVLQREELPRVDVPDLVDAREAPLAEQRFHADLRLADLHGLAEQRGGPIGLVADLLQELLHGAQLAPHRARWDQSDLPDERSAGRAP